MAATRVGNCHQPAEGIVVCPYGERESLNVQSKRRYAPYDGVAFAFGRGVVPFSVGWRFRTVTGGDPFIRFVFVFLLK